VWQTAERIDDLAKWHHRRRHQAENHKRHRDVRNPLQHALPHNPKRRFRGGPRDNPDNAVQQNKYSGAKRHAERQNPDRG
jgi:hypothetical protein